MNAVEVKGFSKNYGSIKAVKNISFTIEEGEIVGFVGKNGAGKTTTLRTITNMIFPTSGEINVYGMDCVKQSKEIKKILSYMPGDASFYEQFTARDIFNVCLKFSSSSFERAQELSEYFELDMDRKVSGLSLGNRKKVSIIQAFLKDAKVYILDEPTNGLDPLMQEKFFALVKEKKENGCSVFLSSHNMSEVEKYCDRVIIIKDGEIIDTVSPETERKNRPLYVAYKTVDGSEMIFDFKGDVNELIDRLHKEKLTAVEIRPKTVEEEFIKYYNDDGEEK